MSDKNIQVSEPAVLTNEKVKTADTASRQNKKATDGKAAADCGSFSVYIGPTIKGVIQSGAVYRGSRKAALISIAGAVEKYPLIATLLVSSKTLPMDRVKVKTPGNLLYVNYHKLLTGER